MRNTRLTNIVLVILLIFNVAFLGSWWYGHWKAHHDRRHEMFGNETKGSEYLYKELDFSPAQLSEYEALLKNHREKMFKLKNSEDEYDMKMMSLISQYPPDSVRAIMYADSVGMVKSSIMEELFRHLTNVKGMCNREQSVRFDELMKRMTEEFPCCHKDFHAAGERTDTNSNPIH